MILVVVVVVVVIVLCFSISVFTPVGLGFPLAPLKLTFGFLHIADKILDTKIWSPESWPPGLAHNHGLGQALGGWGRY